MTVTGRRLILLRHGLTAWNAESRWQGHADVPLTEEGEMQAKAAAATLAWYAPTRIVSSDLGRARSTAEAVAAACDLQVSYDPRLRELDVGEFSGLTHGEVRERFGTGPYDHSRHGGESETQVIERMRAAVDGASAGPGPADTVVVVSHGAAIRMVACDLLGWPAETARTLGSLDNCGWIELVDGQTGWHGPAPWKLAAYNRVTPIS